jgi:hypothetical protein
MGGDNKGPRSTPGDGSDGGDGGNGGSSAAMPRDGDDGDFNVGTSAMASGRRVEKEPVVDKYGRIVITNDLLVRV